MSAWLLLAALAAAEPTPSEMPPAPSFYEVVPSTTALGAARAARGLLENLHLAASRRAELLKSGAPGAAAQVAALEARYRADRAALLERLALLQDWAMKNPSAEGGDPALKRALTAAGRAALGRRKVRAADFTEALAPSDLPFQP